MGKKYTLEFDMHYFNCDNFKQKDALILIKSLNESRLNFDLQFSGYGSITFNDWDTPHQYPTFEELPEYNKSKTNCLIFDVVQYTQYYDKLYIYWTNNLHIPNYGAMFYNTETGDMLQRSFIEYSTMDLQMNLTNCFLGFARRPIFEAQAEKDKNIVSKRFKCPEGQSLQPHIIEYHKKRREQLGIKLGLVS